MEVHMKYKLRQPVLSDKQEFLAFISEWGDEKLIIPAAVQLKGRSYEQFISELPLREKGLIDMDKLVPDNTYILVDKKNHIYGALNFRHTLNDYLMQYGGHIGYGIRPSERGKGFGNMILKEGLEIAKKFGLDKVLITCDEQNIPSARVIQGNGGKFENKVYKNDGWIHRYWVNLK